MENPEQELQFKFQMFEQQIMGIQQQQQAVEQALVDMAGLNVGLDDIKKDKEIMAPIGRGIFAKAKLISEELTVDIGGKNYVTKTIPETKKLIENQLKKLGEVKTEMNSELERINQELTQTMLAGQTKGK